MLLKTFEKIKELDTNTRNMMFAFWVYNFGHEILNIFLNVFVFIKTQSFSFLILYNSIFYTGCMFGFVIVGYYVSRLQILMKYHFLTAFVVFFLSFFVLNFPQTHFFILFAFLNGLGLGMFWVGFHSFEMIYTQNSTRDFYSSMRTVGSQLNAIIAPLFATFSFVVSKEVFGLDPFQILFWVLPCLFLLAMPFILKLSDFVPQKVRFYQFKKLFFNGKKKVIETMYLFDSVEWVMLSILIPFIALNSLKTVVNIGLFETLIGIFAIFVTVVLSHSRHAENRSTHLFYGFIGLFATFSLLLFFDLSIYVYITYSLTRMVFKPIWDVSLHTIHLASVEYLTKSEKNCFYAELLYRDFVLWIGRIFTIGLLWMIFALVRSEIMAIKTSLIVLIFLLVIKLFATKRVDLMLR